MCADMQTASGYPLHACHPPVNLHSTVLWLSPPFFHMLYNRMSTYFYIYIIIFVGLKTICSKHWFNPPLQSKCHATWCCVITHKHIFVPCCATTPQNVNSGAKHQNSGVFSVPAGTGTGWEAAFLGNWNSSVYFHVSAISFVSCLPGSKSWEHNGPCLSLDNSHYEWERERGSGGEWQKGATGSSLHSELSIFLGMCRIS